MSFLFVTQDQQDDQIVAAIASREQELSNYDLNKVNFEQILTTYADLAEEWPASILAQKGKDPNKAAEQLSGETLDLYNQYYHRDQVRHLLKTTIAERAKSAKVYDALLASLTQERLDAAVARYQTAQTAATE